MAKKNNSELLIRFQKLEAELESLFLDCGIDDFLEYENEPASPFYVDRVVNKISLSFSENPKLKLLFDISKKLNSDDVEMLISFAKRMAD